MSGERGREEYIESLLFTLKVQFENLNFKSGGRRGGGWGGFTEFLLFIREFKTRKVWREVWQEGSGSGVHVL